MNIQKMMSQDEYGLLKLPEETHEQYQAKRLTAIKNRLEELRAELRAECISYGELAELQSLAAYIDPSDVELLETRRSAGVSRRLPTR